MYYLCHKMADHTTKVIWLIKIGKSITNEIKIKHNLCQKSNMTDRSTIKQKYHGIIITYHS